MAASGCSGFTNPTFRPKAESWIGDVVTVRTRVGERVTLDGCDVFDGSQYPVFFDCAGLRYARLSEIVKLPYPDDSFDAVLASGVLEHVPLDYESLKELHRVLRVGGRLIVSYL